MTTPHHPPPVPARTGPPTGPDRTDPGSACPPCGRTLDLSSPSGDFCSEDCQQAWYEIAAGAAPAGGTTAPDEALPESAPARPLRWLGPAPAGAYLPAGHEVLDAVAGFVSRFTVFPSEHCAPTLALWYAHTHAAEHFYVTPRLILTSAEPGSGKTRVLEVAQFLVAAPEMTISATAPALFRLVGMGPITILFDEVDAIFNPKTGGTSEDLRALLNAGYKRTATVARCVGDAKAMKVQRFPVYAPAALAGLAGAMPATITTRAITIHLRRRAPHEHVEEFWEEDVERQARPLREQLAAWMDTITDRIGHGRPAMPDGVRDRAAEIWRPLLAIADAAGGHWPATARAACTHFVSGAATAPASRGIQLLADLRAVFTHAGTDRMRTSELLTALCELEESDWGDLNGRPLEARRLAKELAAYGASPVTFETGDGASHKGYVTYPTTGRQAQTGLADAWGRYLPPPPSVSAVSAVSPQVRSLPIPDLLTDPSVSTHPLPTPELIDPSVRTNSSVSP